MKKHSEYIAGTVILVIMGLLMGSVCLRAFTREILVRRFNVVNPLVRIAWYNVPEKDLYKSGIDWQELYPFPEKPFTFSRLFTKTTLKSILTWPRAFVQNGKDTEKPYTGDRIMPYTVFVDIHANYQNLIHWHEIDKARQINGMILTMDDGQLYLPIGRIDTKAVADSVYSLSEFCKERNISFLYVQGPYKVSPEDSELAGISDFSNENIDNMFKNLLGSGVFAYDPRENIHAEKLNHHDLFFRTDHHWTPETGLWVSKHILEKLNEQYGYNLDTSLLDENRFTKEIYPEWYLGSYGRDVTLLNTKAEDISLLYPNYPTDLRYQIPNRNMDISGDFSILYMKEMLSRIDYYNLHAYSAYLYGNKPLETIINQNAGNDLHVLLLRDSFGSVIAPFLSLAVNRLDTIDPREFTGSIRSFIDQEHPDLVMVLYSPFCLNDPTLLDSHKSLMDFR